MLDQFYLCSMHRIMSMGFSWQDRISYTKMLRWAQVNGIEALMMKVQLQWVGNVTCMDDSHFPKVIFLSQLASSTREVRSNQGVE